MDSGTFSDRAIKCVRRHARCARASPSHSPVQAGLDGLVWSLEADGHAVYVGGGFLRAGGFPAWGLAAFLVPSKPPSDEPPVSLLVQAIPNPSPSGTTIRFSLPEAMPVTLSVFDLQGRRIATLLDRASQEAGAHDVRVPTEHWEPGVYLYRLQAGVHSVTRRIAVIR